MPLGLRLVSAPLGSWWRRPRLDDLSRALRDLAAASDPLLATLVRVGRLEHERLVFLFPGEEPVHLSLSGRRLVCTARTHGAGPGYHIFLIELLDRLIAGLGRRWTEVEDGSGYHRSRDEAGLRAAMLAWLAELSVLLVERAGDGPATVSMPPDTEVPPEGGFVTPLGLRERAYFEAGPVGEDWFPWWNRGLDAQAARRAGLYLLFAEVAWHPTADADEDEDIRRALACFARARELDATIEVPEAELEEARGLLDRSRAEAEPPPDGRLGLKRRVLWRALAEWSLPLPGYWYREVNDSTVAYSFGERAVHASVYRVPGRTREQVLGRTPLPPGVAVTVRFAVDDLVVEAGYNEDDEGSALQARAAVDGHLCILTLAGPPEDRAWMEPLLRRLRPPPVGPS